MDKRAQEIMTQITEITGSFGTAVQVSRLVQAATPVKNIFGASTNATTSTFQAEVIVEDLVQKLTLTVAGVKNIETLSMIVGAGILMFNDEITYQNHTYRVTKREPVNFVGTNVVEFIGATREVD